MPQPTRVTLQCTSHGADVQIQMQFISGTGILYHVNNCHVTSKFLSIVLVYSGQTTVQLQPNHIIVPPIPDFLTIAIKNTFSVAHNTLLIHKQLYNFETDQKQFIVW